MAKQPQHDRAYQQRNKDQQDRRHDFHLSVFRRLGLYGGSVELKTSGGAGRLNSLRHVTSSGLRMPRRISFFRRFCLYV